jgi:S-DNA-T family DNA segregation ATPase FtsK/SpoIIIE
VKQSVLREIWGISYLALAVFTYLSINKNFGLIGEIWTDLLKPVLGWGIQGLPVVFLAFSILMFFSKRVGFAASRIVGIVFLVISSLSILHLYVPMDSIYSEAQAGRYGGYIGFVMNFLFRQVVSMGSIGSIAVFLTIFLIGVLLTFEISLGAFFSFFKPQIKIIHKKESARAMKQAVINEEIEDELESMDENEMSDENVQRERFKMAQEEESGEFVTIKRPVVNVSEKKSKERMIQIKEEDIEEFEAKEISGDDFAWEPPSMDLLNPAVPDVETDDALLQENAKKIKEKLKQFGLEVDMHEVHVGPTVIQYTLRPNEGIKLSKITGLKNDLALALAAKAIRIEAPIPGKSLVGIEVPNDHRTAVHLRELLDSKEFGEIKSTLRLPLGRDVAGKPICTALDSMPHLLVAGTTGSGKSVGMNGFLLSLLYQNSPHDLKLILIDPKRVELTNYNGIPHLLTPVITDPEKAAIALRWAVVEMNRRYQVLSEHGHRNITEWNQCTENHDAETDEKGHHCMTHIVIVIDELADLMMAAGKEVEASICRVAQMARAVGMHLIVATQSPRVDVITGLIKANIPTRIAYAVSSSIDSRVILDGIGAEDLLGKGDMLYQAGDAGRPVRVQGIFVSSKEIEKVTNNIKAYGIPPNYVEDIISPRMAQQKVQGMPESDLGDMDDEELYEQALNVVVETRKASASLLQRRLKLGYARAARLLDLMEKNGVIGPVNGAKARDVFI